MNSKLISVIIPIYNREFCLSRCIDSALSQKNVNTEIILVDDGSTDSSLQVCNDYAQNNDNVIVIHTANKGAGHARNIGLDNAKGDYIFFLDSDDALESDALFSLLQSLENSGSDYCIGGIAEYNASGSLLRTISFPDKCSNKSVDTDTAFICSFDTNFPVMDIITAKLYQRKIWENLRFGVGKAAEDTMLVPEIARRTDHIFFLDKPIYRLYLSEASIMRTPSAGKYFDLCESSRVLVDYYIQRGYYDAASFRFGEGTRTLLEARKNVASKDSDAFRVNYLGFCDLALRLLPYASFKRRFQLKLFMKNLPLYAKTQSLYSSLIRNHFL